jgi:hypothetical protein
VVARTKAWTLFARSNAGIVGSNPTQDMDVWWVYAFILCLRCPVFRYRPCDGLITRPRSPTVCVKKITELNKRPGPWMVWKSHGKNKFTYTVTISFYVFLFVFLNVTSRSSFFFSLELCTSHCVDVCFCVVPVPGFNMDFQHYLFHNLRFELNNLLTQDSLYRTAELFNLCLQPLYIFIVLTVCFLS